MVARDHVIGLTLVVIGQALDALPPKTPPTRDHWDHLAVTLRAVLNDRIDHLFALLDERAVEDAADTDR